VPISVSARKNSARGDIVLALSTREPHTILSLIGKALGNFPSTVNFKLDLFTRRSIDHGTVKFNHENVHISIHEGRIGPEYWGTISRDKDVLICGPNAFADAAEDGLRAAGVPQEKIQGEGLLVSTYH
jgi:hypothetical protein